MKHQIKTGMLLLSVAALITATSQFSAARDKNDDTVLQRATETLQRISEAPPDRGVPGRVLRDAKCVAVIPHLVKGAFIVGGEHGVGVATCKTPSGWSAPAPFSVTGISWGLQAGGESSDIMMFIMNDEGMRSLLEGHIKVGADVSAAAGPVGGDASASAGWNAGILTYSGSKGAFAGASLGGAELQQDGKLTRDWYGHDVSFKEILSGNAQSQNPDAQAFVSSVQNARRP